MPSAFMRRTLSVAFSALMALSIAVTATSAYAQGGGRGGAFSFGKSRARMLTQKEGKVTFDDVAGIDEAKQDKDAELIYGGHCDKTKGYFVQPTLIQAKTPTNKTMCEELFGPVLTIYVYPDAEFSKTLKLVDQTGVYALTGSIISQDRASVEEATAALTHAAGNFYINDKPTGAVVGQQPFGGARASGTNDKAGSVLNLLRWTNPRTIKETFVPPHDYTYPFMK